jgi:hypothetical protein
VRLAAGLLEQRNRTAHMQHSWGTGARVGPLWGLELESRCLGCFQDVVVHQPLCTSVRSWQRSLALLDVRFSSRSTRTGQDALGEGARAGSARTQGAGRCQVDGARYKCREVRGRPEKQMGQVSTGRVLVARGTPLASVRYRDAGAGP